MAVTSSDVARRAGVSQATVSYVLNDTPGQTISEHTREKVLRAMHELGYWPNAAARALRTGKNGSVLFPVPGLARNHVASQLVQACSDALTTRGLTLVADFTVYASTAEQLDAWRRLAPAAVIDLILSHDDPVLGELRRSGVPVLASTDAGALSESPSDVMAIDVRVTQLRYMLERGHRRIAYVQSPRSDPAARITRRLAPRLRAIAKAAGAELTVHGLALSSRDMSELVETWAANVLPDAVCAATDEYAIAAMTALMARGISVPGDVAVIGVDDIPAASYVTPLLTTITADFREYGEAVAAAVDSLISTGERELALPLPGHSLVVRESA